jgi:hypothetical protein
MRIQDYVDFLNSRLQTAKTANETIIIHCIVTILSYFKDIHFNDVIQTPEDLLYILLAQRDLEENMSIVYLEEGLLDEFASSQEKVTVWKDILKELGAV